MTTRRKFIKNTTIGTGAFALGLTGASQNLFANEKVTGKRITTVTGDILPEALGYTTMHEHTICDMHLLSAPLKKYMTAIPPEMLTLKPENMTFLRSGSSIFSEECSTKDDVEYMVAEFNAFKKNGGKAVCDASPIGLRGDANKLKKASEMAGVHLICATGLYTSIQRPTEYLGISEKENSTIFEREINEGIDGTDVKPGFLKCAIATLTPSNTIEESEIATVKACAKIAARNGMSVHVHTSTPLTGDHIINVASMMINECGLLPDRLLMMHMDSFIREPKNITDYISDFESVKTVNTDCQEKLLDKGINIGFDSWTALVSILPDDNDRLKALVHLLKKGYGSQIVLGHDITDKARGETYGYYGFSGFTKVAIPILRQLKFGNDVIAKLTVENPARILAY